MKILICTVISLALIFNNQVKYDLDFYNDLYEQAFDAAYLVEGVGLSWIQSDWEGESVTSDSGMRYYKANDEKLDELGIENLEDLRGYLSQFFTEEIVESLISKNYYIDIDGELWVNDGARGAGPYHDGKVIGCEWLSHDKVHLTYSISLEYNNNIEILYFEFYLDYANGQFLFSEFPIFY